MTTGGDISSAQLPPWETPFPYKHPLSLTFLDNILAKQ